MRTRDGVVLELFVQGQSALSNAAIDLVRRVCDAHLRDSVRLEVVDVRQQPERARSDDILATPALIRRHPKPVVRITGGITEARILHDLDIACA